MKNKIILIAIVLVCFCTFTFVINNYVGSKSYIIGDTSKWDKNKKYSVIHASIVGYSEDDLMVKSDIIIKGKVDKIHASKWSNPDGSKLNPLDTKVKATNTITTDVDIKIEKLFKGIPYNSNKITIRNPNGQVGDRVVYGEHIPDFNLGENVILFLKKDNSDIATDENYYVLSGYYQGKYVYDGEVNGSSVYKSKGASIKVSELENKIKNAIDYAKEHPKKEMTPEEIYESNKRTLGIK